MDNTIKFNQTWIEFSNLPDELKQAHQVWDQSRGDSIGPSWKAFDMTSLPKHLLPYSSVADYDTASDQFKIRFFGSGLVEIDGVEMTGKNLDETPNPDLRVSLLRLFKKVVREAQANFAEFQFLSLAGTERLSISGRWPLSENGADVSGVLAVVKPLESRRHLNNMLDPLREPDML